MAASVAVLFGVVTFVSGLAGPVFLLWMFFFSPLCCSGSVVLFLGEFVYCNSEVLIVLLPGSFSSLCMTCTQS
jgi:hypothetical protein